MNAGVLKKKLKGMRIRTVLYVLLAVMLVLLLVLRITVIFASKGSQKLSDAAEDCIEGQQAAQDAWVATDALSEIARQYVVTQDEGCVEEYFAAVEEKEEKIKILYNMKITLFADDADVRKAIETALVDSNAVMDAQLHAIRLTADLAEYDLSTATQELQDYELTAEEEAYSEQELQTAAYHLVFGEDYATQSQTFEEDMQLVWETIADATMQEENDSADRVSSSLCTLEIFTDLMFIAWIVLFIAERSLVVKPIEKSVQCVANKQRLDLSGAKELRFLAEHYNHLCEKDVIRKTELAHEAKHDPLTGLMNRGGFDKLKEYLKETFEPIALILLDVDNFKGVNDNYGHEVGDEALKRVASLMIENFRSEDYPIRMGGDEFAVIMTNITPAEKDIIRKKVDNINEKLSVPEDRVPRMSLSVGIAFSRTGYNEELYSQADRALYKTKENGKCGYTFYGDWK